MANRDRRRMSDEDIERIAAAAAQAVIKSGHSGCVCQVNQKQHENDHAFIQRLEKLFDRIENTNWKILQSVLIVLAAAAVVWFLFRLGIDVRKWKP